MIKSKPLASRAAAPEGTPAPVVAVRGLCKRFTRPDGSTVHAIDDVSLDLFPGEFMVLLGPSGCGKTTLLRSIAGLEQPDSGTIITHGRTNFSSEDGIDIPPEGRRDVSIVFQSYALWPHMTAFGNVAYPLGSGPKRVPKREVTERVCDVLELMGVGELKSSYPSQMSGGQQQRVALARALVSGTDLVLFDEPLSNVDAKVREQLRIELLEMQHKIGFAALFVTHDQTEAMVLAHRIAVLQEGRIAQMGSPEEIYNAPASRYVGNFIGTGNEVAGTVVRVDKTNGTTVRTPLGELTTTDTDTAAGRDVVVMWRPERTKIHSEPRSGPNVMEGRLRTRLFLGTQIEHLVDVHGQRLRVLSPSDPGIAQGSTVWLTVKAGDARIFPNTG